MSSGVIKRALIEASNEGEAHACLLGNVVPGTIGKHWEHLYRVPGESCHTANNMSKTNKQTKIEVMEKSSEAGRRHEAWKAKHLQFLNSLLQEGLFSMEAARMLKQTSYIPRKWNFPYICTSLHEKREKLWWSLSKLFLIHVKDLSSSSN